MGSGRKSRWAGDAGEKQATTAVTESERNKTHHWNFFPEGSWKSMSENRKSRNKNGGNGEEPCQVHHLMFIRCIRCFLERRLLINSHNLPESK